MLLMRIVINAISLAIVAILIPDIYFAERSIKVLLVVSIGLGIINALIKPVIQFLTFQLIFASFGIVIIVINALLLWLLGRFFSDWFMVNSIFWALVGGALLGGLSSFLESLFGLTRPIVSTEDRELTALLQGEKRDVVKTILDHKQPRQEDPGFSEIEIEAGVDEAAIPIAPEIATGAASRDSEALDQPAVADSAPASAASPAGGQHDSPATDSEPELTPANPFAGEDNAL